MSAQISVLHPQGEKSVEATGHQRELEIAVYFHGNGGRESIHMEEVNAVGDAVFNDHPLSVASDQLRGGATELVGEQERGVLVAEIGDDQLAKGARVAGERNVLIEDAGRAVFPRDAGQFDAAPGRQWELLDFLNHLRRTPA